MAKHLNSILKDMESVREEFELGQAAQGLFELKKAANKFNEFVEVEFTKEFKALNNDPRNVEMALELSKKLSTALKELSGVVSEVDSYLMDYDLHMDPESPSRGKQHEPNRWKRWEHREPRHVANQFKDEQNEI